MYYIRSWVQRATLLCWLYLHVNFFPKWYREMGTICFSAVLFWQEPLRTLYVNEFCLCFMKTLLSPERSRNWRRSVNIWACCLFPHSSLWLFCRLRVKSVPARLDCQGEKKIAYENGTNEFHENAQPCCYVTYLDEQKCNKQKTNSHLSLLRWLNTQYTKKIINGRQDFLFQFFKSTNKFTLLSLCFRTIITFLSSVGTNFLVAMATWNTFEARFLL